MLWIGIGVVIGGILLLIGLGLFVQGLISARNSYVALFGDETAVADVDTGDDATNVKLTGTVSAVPDPVETLDGRGVGIYRIRAVLKNRWNLFKKRTDVKRLLADATELESVVLQDESGAECQLTAEPGTLDRRWGDVQQADRNWLLETRRDFVTPEWTERRTFSGDGGVPEEVKSSLRAAYDADTSFDVSKLGVGFVLAEDVVETGDAVRIAGKVRPTAPADVDDRRAAATDGGAPAVALDLTPGATVTSGSWRALAWANAKLALLKVPMGLILVGAAAVLVVQTLGRGGVL